MSKKNLLECEICFENKKYFISCERCKKKICHDCIIKYLSTIDNILEQSKCAYCRYYPNIKSHWRQLEELNEALEKNNSKYKIKIKTTIKIDSDSGSDTEEDIELIEPIEPEIMIRNQDMVILSRTRMNELINERANIRVLEIMNNHLR